MVKKIIKAGIKKALKSKRKSTVRKRVKVRLPPKAKSAKMKKAQVSLTDRKRAAAMAHVRKLEKQGHTKAANKARAWIHQGDAFRRGSGTREEFHHWAKEAKTLGPSRERLQHTYTSKREMVNRQMGELDKAIKREKVRKRSADELFRQTFSINPRRSPPGIEHFTKFVPYGSASKPGWAKGFGKKPVRKGSRTVAGLDREDWFVAGLGGSGPAIGAAYWEHKEKINKLPGNAIDVVRARRDALLRRLGLI